MSDPRAQYSQEGDAEPPFGDASEVTDIPDGAEVDWPSESAHEPGLVGENAGDAGPAVAEAPHAAAERSRACPVTACTVTSSRRLPAARVLRDSFLRAHPDGQFSILLLDGESPGTSATVAGEQVLRPFDIGVDPHEFARLAIACTEEQLTAVLRPRLLAALLRDEPAGPATDPAGAGAGPVVVHLDPEVLVLGDVSAPLADALRRAPVALVPRVLAPLPRDGMRPSAGELADAGTFDPGMVAVSTGSGDFLSLWRQQLLEDPDGTAAFLDGAPALVEHEVVRDPGVGLSAWNAAHRELLRPSDGVGGESAGEAGYPGALAVRTRRGDPTPLRSVHFADFQPNRPWLLSARFADRPRVLLSEHPELARLCAAYRGELVRAGGPPDESYAYDTLLDDTPIPTALRADYFAEWTRRAAIGATPPRSPFEAGGTAGKPDASVIASEFLDWACSPGDDTQEAAGGSRWTAAVWRDDPALRRDYPDPFDGDAVSFREWCAGVGVASGRVPSAATPRARRRATPALVDQLGVSIVGSGPLAERVRLAARASGLPHAETPTYPVVLRCEPGVAVPSGWYLVEVRGDLSPDTELPGAVETWVPSETSRAVARRIGAPPAKVLPMPVVDRGSVDLPSRKSARARLGVDAETVFGSVVDHAVERQGNGLGLVHAFLSAFADRTDVRLLLGVRGANRYPEAAERLRLATVTDPRITLLEEEAAESLSTGAPGVWDDLVEAADCVVSLHRADGGVADDGVALWLRDAAARGVPVLSSDQGAVAELIGDQGARLVDCLGGGEPETAAAADWLRQFANDPRARDEFAVQAREYLLYTHDQGSAGEQLRERVERAYRAWRSKWSQDRQGQGDDPLRPLVIARHALHRSPDVGVSSKVPMAPALRKAVLRVLQHYDAHLRDVMGSVVEGVERSAQELLRRQGDTQETGEEGEAETVRASLTRLSDRQSELADQLVSTDDGMLRLRTDLAGQHRRLEKLEEQISTAGAGSDEKVDSLAGRLDQLTAALERTLDRVDSLERRVTEASREREERVETGLQAAAEATRRIDVLQRIVLREHERANGADDSGTTVVLSDAGLLRLPVGDGAMLPFLSTHGTWDTAVSELIDSLVEPDGVFLDVGAYVGYQAVRVLSRLGNSGAVVAVEPCPQARELLRHNAEVNLPAASATRMAVVESAAWDSATELIGTAADSGGLTLRPPREGEDVMAAGGEGVSAARLDKAFESLPEVEGLRLSVVHADIAGRDHRVLGGLVRLLRRDRPHIVCSFTPSAVEQLGDDPTAVLREYTTWGYELVPVGRTEAVSADELLTAVARTGESSTVKLWLRPKGRAS